LCVLVLGAARIVEAVWRVAESSLIRLLCLSVLDVEPTHIHTHAPLVAVVSSPSSQHYTIPLVLSLLLLL